ncbi:MAG: hypothetical protein KDK64_05690 [Chlamydiia bacterium]|nr:hypothetical protein [Chlamydiia bacterium]
MADNSKFYIHSGAQLTSLAVYFLLAAKVQGYCSFNAIIGATALQYIRSNQINDAEANLFYTFNGKRIGTLCDQLNQKQVEVIQNIFHPDEPKPLFNFNNDLSIYVPSMILIGTGCLLSRVGVKVWVLSLTYFGIAYHLIHTHRPKRVDLPLPKRRVVIQPPREGGEEGRAMTPPPVRRGPAVVASPNKSWGALRAQAEQSLTTSFLRFYSGEGKGGCHYTLDNLLFEMDESLAESRHDYIQWLFPLHQPTRTPRLTDGIIEVFTKGDKQGIELQRRQKLAFIRMLHHYGLVFKEDTLTVKKNGVTFDAQKKYLTPGNHNLLRITRILTSLVNLGQPELAKAFHDFLDAFTRDERPDLRPTFERHWHPITAWDAI